MRPLEIMHHVDVILAIPCIDLKKSFMRILFISSIYPNPIEPSRGCFNQSLVRGLAKNHQVEVISPIPWVNLAKGFRKGGRVAIFQRLEDPAGVGLHYVPFIYPPRILRDHYGAFYWNSVERTVRTLVENRTPELVIGYWAHPDGAAAVRIGRLVGAPSCVIIGGSDVLILTNKPSRRKRVQDVLTATDAVITVNDHLRRSVEELGVSADRVHVWRQGVDVDRFHPGDQHLARQRIGTPISGRHILWVGRMDPVKGLDVLFEACALLLYRGVDYHLHLVGEGAVYRDLVAQAASLGIASRVTFAGAKRHDELPNWYRAADVTVLPSRSEGLPNVLRESLACGVPFVASDVGGIREISEPGSSVLVPPEDPPRLAEALELALDRWAGRRSASRSEFESWEGSADALAVIMQRYVTEHRSKRYIEPRQAECLV